MGKTPPHLWGFCLDFTSLVCLSLLWRLQRQAGQSSGLGKGGRLGSELCVCASTLLVPGLPLVGLLEMSCWGGWVGLSPGTRQQEVRGWNPLKGGPQTAPRSHQAAACWVPRACPQVSVRLALAPLLSPSLSALPAFQNCPVPPLHTESSCLSWLQRE